MSRPACRHNSRNRRRRVLCVLVVVSAVGLVGCEMLGLGGDDSDRGGAGTNGGGARAGKDDAGTSGATGAGGGGGADAGGPSLPELAGSGPDAGTGGARRNPFAPKVTGEEDEDEEDQLEKAKKQVGPMQKHPLEEYSLVGIISEVAVPKAMFIAPTGKGHLLKEAEAIGSEGGVIQDIRSNAVDIEVPGEGQGGGAKKITLELQKRTISTKSESELSPRERETLEELMESEEGRKAVRERFEKKAPAGNAADREGRRRRKRRAPPGSRQRGQKGRVPGRAPPE